MPNNDLGAVLGGRYKLERQLGGGGYGTVWVATDVTLGQQVAVKRMLDVFSAEPELKKRFEREALLTARVRHDHVVRVSDFGCDEAGHPYYVMEFLDGESLDSVVKRGPIPLDRALTILKQVLSALQAIHAGGVLHRDLKPANIMLQRRDLDGDETAQDWVKLIDFGIAKATGQTALTEAGLRVGTPPFWPPEVWTDDYSPSVATDIYAAGALLAMMLTGRPPEPAKSPVDLSMQSTTALLPGEIVNLVARATATRPRDRFPTAVEFREAVVDYELQQLAIGTHIGGRYIVEEFIGVGGQGVVYRAVDANTNTKVAVKLLLSPTAAGDAGARFEREAQAGLTLDHPSLIRVLDAGGRWRGRPYFVMELFDGGHTLNELWGRMSWAEALSVLKQVASGLDYLASLGFVHRDVNPRNILVDANGRAKLIDLGVARDVEHPMTRSSFLGVFGTSGFIAPETIRPSDAEAASDQFSLACAIYWLLAGVTPHYFEAQQDEAEAQRRIFDGARAAVLHKYNDTVSPATSDIVARALSPDPKDRFASCEAFVTALAEASRANMQLGLADEADGSGDADNDERTVFAPGLPAALLEQYSPKAPPPAAERAEKAEQQAPESLRAALFRWSAGVVVIAILAALAASWWIHLHRMR